MATDLNAKRISDLDEMTASIIEELRTSTENSKNWVIPLDFDKNAAGSSTDLGTLKLPMSNIALLGTDGKVSASMLPSYIDEIKCGTMEDMTTYKKFTDDQTGSVYAAPHQEGMETPPEHTIFMNDADSVQYRYVSSDDKFAVIPASLALSAGYGAIVENKDTTTEVSVKAPIYASGITSSATKTLADKDFDATLQASDTITAYAVDGTGVQFKSMNKSAMYNIDIQLIYSVSGLSPNIASVNLTLTNGAITHTSYGNIDLSVEYDQPVSYHFTVRTGGKTSMETIVVNADPDIPDTTTVSIKRGYMYITEIL